MPLPWWLKPLFAARPTIRRATRSRSNLMAERLEDRLAPAVSTFQQGVGGYTGTQDVELRQSAPDSNRNSSGTILIDFDSGTVNSHGLLRFDNIIGSGPGQIPAGAFIKSAYLTLNTTNPGDGGAFHRMIVNWSQTTATWNSLVNGVTLGTDALTEREGNAGNDGGNNDVPTGNSRLVYVTDSVQAWANGADNFGWGIIGWNTLTDGWEFAPSETGTAANRPMLTVEWEHVAGASLASFQDGVGGYTGTTDTVIRQDFPTTNNATTQTVFVDAIATTGQDQVLLRFDNIFGTGTGQIPIGSTILGASLMLSSNTSNAQGDGGRFHRLRDTWVDTSTWASSFGGNGIDADDVEALATFTTAAGNAALNGDPQSNRNVFDITADLQAWSDGDPNFGWGILPWPGGGDGWGIRTSEAPNVGDRPRLSVYFIPPPPEPDANTFDLSSGTATYAGGVGLANNVTVSVSGGAYTFTDSSGPITLTQAAKDAGFSGSGTNTVTGPSSAVNGITVTTGTNGDTVTVQSVEDPITIDGGNQPADVLNLPNGVSVAGDASFTRFNTINVGSGQLLDVSGMLTLSSKTGLGTAGTPLKTKAGVIVASGGNGGVFIEEQDGAEVTFNATGSGAVTITNLAGTLTIAGASGASNGTITLSSADDVAVNAAIGNATTTGRILISANTDGSGSQGYTQGAAGNLLTVNTGTASGSEAVVITVNTGSGGTGDATLGTGSTAGTLKVVANGGNILWASGLSVPDPVSGTNTSTLAALNYDLATSGSGSIGTAARPIQTNALTDTAVANLTAGSGGIFLTDWGTPDLTVASATATGAGNIQLFSANASGSNLTVGNITTGSGSIVLSADDDLFITGTVGGASFSGTIDIKANRDAGNEQRIVMSAGAKIQTTNTSATAVRLGLTATDNDPENATYGGIVLGDIIVGDGGTITVVANDSATSDGGITVLSGTSLDAGATGRVVLTAGSDATNSSGGPPIGSAFGTAALPVVVSAGTITITSRNTDVFVRSTSAANLTGVVTNSGNLTVSATAALTVAGVTRTGGGTITLDATGQAVAVNAALGDATTGDVSVTGSTIAYGVPLTVPNGKTYTLTAGSLVDLSTTTTVTGTLTASGGVAVGPNETLDGTGTINGAVAAVGSGAGLAAVTINGTGTGQLTTGGFTGSSNTTLTVDLAGTTAGSGFDQLITSGGATLAGTRLLVNVPAGFTPTVGNSFRIVDVTSGSVSGQFDAGTSIIAANDARYQFGINYAGGDGNDIVLTLTAILNPPVIHVFGGQLTYTGGTGANVVGVSVTGGVYTITDSSADITLTQAAIDAGFTLSDARTATGPSSVLSSLFFNLGTGDDSFTLASAEDSVTVIGGGDSNDTLAITGTVTGAAVTATGFTAITSTAAGFLQAGTVTLGATAIGTPGANILTQADVVVLAGGTGGVFVTEADGASVTATASGSGAVSITNTTGTLTVAGNTTTGDGPISLASGDGIVVNADIGSTTYTGQVTIAANTDGTGTEGYTQAAAARILTKNSTDATGNSAIAITVNTTGGGTGNATLAGMTAGSTSGTVNGGRITVSANGGSILWGGTGLPANVDTGSAPAARLLADTFAFTTIGSGSIGSAAAPIQSGNIGTSDPANQNTVALASGSGGIYWWDWDAPDLNIGSAIATGGDISIVSANVGGHNLNVVGTVSTTTGNIYLGSNDDLTIASTAVIGGAGMSGTITVRGNRDEGTAGQPFTMQAGAIIRTSNTSANAVYLDIAGNTGTPSTLTVADVIVGDGGTITINAIPNGVALESGRILQAAGTRLDAGATGTVVLVAARTTVDDAIGTSSQPITVTAGTVIATATFGNIFVTEADGATFTATTTDGGSITLATAAGALTIGGATNTDGGTLTLTGPAGVVLNATLGDGGTAAISITGPLSGSGNIQLGTAGLTLTTDADSTYDGVISGGHAVTKGGPGALTLTSTSTFSGLLTLNAGSLVVDGALTGAGGVTTADSTALGGSGSVAGPVTVAGTIDPGAPPDGPFQSGSLGTGNLSFDTAGTRAVLIDLGGTTAGTGYDQIAVTSTADLTGATLSVSLASGFEPPLGNTFTIIDADAVSGTFASLPEGATIVVGAYEFTISYASGDVVLTTSRVPNVAPAITAPGSQTATEDTDLVFSTANGNVITITDADAGTGELQVTLTATNGVLTLATTTGLGFTDGDGTADATMTFTGTLAEITAALNGLRFRSPLNYNGSAALTIGVDDQGNTGTGGPLTASDVIAITVDAVNDAPVNTLPAGPLFAEEGGTGNIPGISISDVDAGSATVVVTLSVANGTLTVTESAAGGLTAGDISGNGTGTVTLTGTIAAINATLADGSGPTYTPNPEYTGFDTLTVTTNDLGNSPAPARSDIDTITINIGEVNDAPTAVDDTLADIAEDSGDLVIPFAALTANDSTGPANEAGQTLTITSVGSAVGGSVQIVGTTVVFSPSQHFNGLASFSYVVTDNGTTAGSPDPLTSTATVSFTITPVNDAPVIGNINGAVTFIAGGAAVVIDADASVSDVDSADFDGGTLTVSLGATGQTGDVLAIRTAGDISVAAGTVSYQGTPIGTVTGGAGTDLVVALNGAATPAAVASLIAAITFQNADPSTSPTDRTATFTLDDGDGGTSTSSPVSKVVTLRNPPVVTLATGSLTYTENDLPLGLDTTATVTDADSADFDGGTLSVTITTNATPEDRLTILTSADVTTSGSSLLYQGTAIGSISGGIGTNPLVISFSGGSATPAAATAVLRQIAFSNISESPVASVRTISVVVNDGDGLDSETVTRTISVVSVNDIPVNTLPAGPITTAEDVPVFITGLSVSDLDANAGTISVTLAVTSGQITVSTTIPGGLTAGQITNNGTATVTLSGTLTAINATLAGGSAIRYTPNQDHNGSDTLTMTTSDNGNTGGPARTDTDSVSITITAINDAPTFTLANATVTVNEDDGPRTVNSFATSISAGAVNEAAQVLTAHVTVVGTTDTLTFTAAPSIDPITGTLTFTAAADTHGTAQVEVFLTDDGSDIAPDVNTSITRTFTIIVNPVNDNPIALPDTVTVLQNSGPTTANVLLNDSFAPDPVETLSITSVTQGTSGGTVSIISGGTAVSYQPATTFWGTETFTYTISDGNGGTATGTVTVTVLDVTAPTVLAFTNSDNDQQVATGDMVTFTVTFSEPVAPASVSLGDFEVRGTAGVAVENLQVVGNTVSVDVRPFLPGTARLWLVGTVTDPSGNVVIVPIASQDTLTITGPGVDPGDVTPPTVTAINLTGPVTTDAPTVTFAVTFSEPVTGVDPSDFAVAATGITGAAVLSVTGGGANWVVTVSTGSGNSGTLGVTLLVNGSIRDGANNALTVGASSPLYTIARVTPPVPEPVAPVDQNEVGVFATGTGPGGNGLVSAYGMGGTIAYTVNPFGPTGQFTGVRVAMADVTGDGVADLIAATGPGAQAQFVVIDGVTRAPVRTVVPFSNFAGGLYVAAADLNGDGRAEIAVSADVGGGPRVTIFDGATGAVLANFLGIEDSNFRGGARVALGDINGDGTPDLAVAAGFEGGPRVALFNGLSLRPGSTPTRLRNDFFLFEPSLRDGAFVTLGDLNGDGFAELIGGGGPSGGPRVLALDGRALMAGAFAPVANFFAGDPQLRGGVQLTVKDLDQDGSAELITGVPTGSGAVVSAYRGSTLAPGITPQKADELAPLTDALGGVFVG